MLGNPERKLDRAIRQPVGDLVHALMQFDGQVDPFVPEQALVHADPHGHIKVIPGNGGKS
jgi:hypothetical protein